MAEGYEPQPLGVIGPIVPDQNYPNVGYTKYGKMVVATGHLEASGGGVFITINGFPKSSQYVVVPVLDDTGYASKDRTSNSIVIQSNTSGSHFIYFTLSYITND